MPRLSAARFDKGRWRIETRAGVIDAGIIVNAAGAWADVVAQGMRAVAAWHPADAPHHGRAAGAAGT